MSDIRTKTERVGNFTSSEIWKLTKTAKDKVNFGKPALTYIREKNFERKIGRSLGKETFARDLLWGKCVEITAFKRLGLEYKLCSTETVLHKQFDFWAGTPDFIKDDNTVGDIKCPATLNSFCCATVSTDEKVFIEEHDQGEKYYWQIVSNAILTNSKFGEIIFYCPYKKDLDEIRKRSVDIEFTKTRNEYAWIYHALDEELPYLPDGCGVKDMHIIRFEISKTDKEFLTDRVERAGRMLNKK